MAKQEKDVNETTQSEIKIGETTIIYDDKMYMLHEMRDELKTAISNLQIVMGQENELLDILNNDTQTRFYDWEKFKEGMYNSRQKYEVQLTKMTKRLGIVQGLIELSQNEDVGQVIKMSVSLLLETFA